MAGKRANIAKLEAAVMDALNSCSDDIGDDELVITIEAAEPQSLTKEDVVIDKALGREVPIFKTSEERYVLGVVLEPLKEMGKSDTQSDTYSAAEVRSAAHKFMEDYGVVGLQHQKNVTGKVKILETWIAREDFVVDNEVVKAGTWLMGFRVVDDRIWKGVKDGKITGLSIGGIAHRAPLNPTAN